jgi:GTP-binding protein YchF
MSLSVALVGLPNAGKSTLFKALTKREVAIAPYPFTTINPNIAQVKIIDKRLLKISEILKPEKTTFAEMEFVDVAGLVKGAHLGQGLGNQFLSQIQGCDLLLLVLRAFEDSKVAHSEKTIDPARDLQILKNEFKMKDLKIIKENLKKIEKSAPSAKEEKMKIEVLKKIERSLEKDEEPKLEKEEFSLIKSFQFLSLKPKIILLNTNQPQNFKKEKILIQNEKIPFIEADLKTELDFSQLSENEKKELGLKSLLEKIIKKCYDTLNLITFFTVAGGKEAKAWSLKEGQTLLKAAEKIHSDFAKNFIKAEIIEWEKLVAAGSWKNAKEKGWLKIASKNEIVKDGQVIEIKI